MQENTPPPSTLEQEQMGLAAVHSACNSMRAVWRATTTADLGIDGQIEFLVPGELVSTGRIIAVQVKSGPSYFINQTETFVPFYPQEKHRRYWTSLKLPVFLILHDPTQNLTIYEWVLPYLAAGPIRVPLANVLAREARQALMDIHDAAFTTRVQEVAEPALDSFRQLELHRSQHSGTTDSEPITGIHFLLSAMNPEEGYPGGPYFELRGLRIDAALLAAGGGPLPAYEGWVEFVARCLERCSAYGIIEPLVHDFDTWRREQQGLIDRTVALTPEGQAISNLLLADANRFLTVPPSLTASFPNAQALARHMIAAAEQASEAFDRSDRMSFYPI